MKKSREETKATREKIVRTASKVFRKHGINGIGVADMMRAAGLTHGGFYKHFVSKDALAAEACQSALSETFDELSKSIEIVGKDEAFNTLIDSYLSKIHVFNPEHGCAIAALGAETARSDAQIKDAMAKGIENLQGLIQRQLELKGISNAANKTDGVLSAMVGGLILARNAVSPERSKEILSNTKFFIIQSIQNAN
jgi:TetR/AcrR family transcriptional repressor of nem operon